MKPVVRIPLLAGLALAALLTFRNEAPAAGDTYALVGKPLPEIDLRDRDGNAFPMQRLRGRTTVLFFSEGLMCYPVCWDQIAAFVTDPKFGGKDIVAISVVTDSPRVWQRAAEKMPVLARATVLFDPGAAASRRLGLLALGSSMHPGQLPGHTYLLIDAGGVVREVIDDPNMAVNNELLLKLAAKLKR